MRFNANDILFAIRNWHNAFFAGIFKAILKNRAQRSGSAKLNRPDKCIIGVFRYGKGAGTARSISITIDILAAFFNAIE